MELSLTLEGSIPSKKNSRINLSSGISIPSSKYTEWEDRAILEIRRQTRARFYKPVHIELTVYFGTLALADLDNRLTSVLDMLVAAMVLRDDKWQFVPQVTAIAEHRKNKPGALIKITEL